MYDDVVEKPKESRFFPKLFIKQLNFVYIYILYVNVINLAFIGFAYNYYDTQLVREIITISYTILFGYFLMMDFKWVRKFKRHLMLTAYKGLIFILSYCTYFYMVEEKGYLVNFSLNISFTLGFIFYSLIMCKLNLKPVKSNGKFLNYLSK